MSENSPHPYPIIKDEATETNPYQEQKESLGNKKFDTILVFGHSPIKPLLLEEELTPQQKQEWDSFRSNPLQGNSRGFEPEFRVLQGVYAKQLTDIQQRENIDDETKKALLIAKRIELQHTGRLVLNRVSRVNALSAGLALYLGITDKLVLSGAGTIPGKVSGDAVALPKEVYEHTPSEAKMMQDVIVTTFGRSLFQRDVPKTELENRYTQQFHVPVDRNSTEFQTFSEEQYRIYKEDVLSKKMVLEEKSVNTSENYVEILKLEPDLKKAAIIGPAFHLERLQTLAKLHSISIEPFGAIKDADLLKQRAQIRDHQTYEGILDHMNDPLNNPEQASRIMGDNKWQKALIEPARIGYWLGYITDLDMDRLQNIMDMLANSAFHDPAKEAFAAAGLDFAEYTEKRLSELSDQQLTDFKIKLKDAFHGKGKPLREKAVEGL